MPVIEDKKKRIMRTVRKRDRKTLQAIADDMGAAPQGLTQPIAALVAEGLVVRHADRPPTYTKA